MSNQSIGRISTPMKAPKTSGGSDKERNPDLELIDEGIQDAYLVGIIGLGTHTEKKYQSEEKVDKDKVLLIWEFPQLMQRIYLDEDDLYAFQMYDEKPFSFHEKSGLRKVMKALDNNNTPDSEFDDVDLSSLMHKPIKLGIEHYIKKDSTQGAKIVSYTKMGKQTPSVKCGDTCYLFYIDEAKLNFMTENYAELPNWIKDKIRKSSEAIEHEAQGGTFAERQYSEEDDKSNQPSSNASAPPKKHEVPNGYKFVGKDASYESYREQGWSNKQLLDAALLEKVATAPAPPKEEAKTPPPPPPAKETQPEAINPFEDDDDDDLPF